MGLIKKEDVAQPLPIVGVANPRLYQTNQRSSWSPPNLDMSVINESLEDASWSGLDLVKMGGGAEVSSFLPALETPDDLDVPSSRHLNSVRDLLQTSAEGRAILARGAKASGLLDDNLRTRLCNLLVSALLSAESPTPIPTQKFCQLSDEIAEVFPKESPALYYVPYQPATLFQPKRNQSGWLVNANKRRQKHLISLGILKPKRSRSRVHSPSSRSSLPASVSAPAIPISGLDLSRLTEDDVAEFEESLKKLEIAEPAPWQEIIPEWRSTLKARLRYIYYEKSTLQQYLDRFPILKSPTGYRFLLEDYDLIYPGKGRGLEVLRASAAAIIAESKRRAESAKDPFLRCRVGEILANIDDTEESELSAVILLLAFLINITPVRRSSKDWHASRAETADGFATHVPSETDISTMLAERRRKLKKVKVTFQPLIVYCGNCSRITKAFVVCENTLYEFLSLPSAFDAAFKIFHATGAKYPQEAYDIWLFVQLSLYGVSTMSDRPTAAVKQTMAKLGFTERL